MSDRLRMEETGILLARDHNREALRRGSLDGKIRVMTTDPRFPEVVIPLSGTLI